MAANPSVAQKGEKTGKNVRKRILYIIPICVLFMNYRLQITIVALLVTTIALAPSLISSQLAQAQTTKTMPIKCEDEQGKSHTWITGCKDGWYNWGVCGVGPTQGATGQYDQGYAAGWKKGQEHNPSRSGC
jgi:hypothetical protein